MKTLIVITLALLVSCKKNPFDPNEPGDGSDSTAQKTFIKNELVFRDSLYTANSGTFRMH
jgi:hypothetical protein